MDPNQPAAYGLIEAATLAIEGDRIAWAGPSSELPDTYIGGATDDLEGRMVTPALIDCHTHIVHAGSRAAEFEQRLHGASYAEIAAAGGGIISTVTATRAATEPELLANALRWADRLIAEGVGTIEIKSGYGLDTETELRMLRAARQVRAVRPVHVVTSFLGAHAIPPEYKGRSGDYLEEICLPTLRAAAAEGLADAVDGFCEGIAFSPDEIDRLFKEARALGLPVKLHAEQLSNLGGAALAARHGALSADHIEYLDADSITAMAGAGTVAVLLPGAYYTLRETQAPPVEGLRAAGVPIAVATDANPGSSPMASLLLAMNMACTFFRLTPEEALAGTTRNAARALGLQDRGIVREGMRADLAVWEMDHPAELCWRIGWAPLMRRIFGGQG
ncbi:MAG: imidazolonepropionase [Pseudomonadota bacterium]